MSQIHNGTRKPVDINALVNCMTRELDYYWSLGEVPENGESSCVIHKVQQHIRMVDKFSYEPCMLSIGPYHHGAPALRNMQKEKWSYLDYILHMNYDKSLLDYLCALEGLAKFARNCYSEEINMNGEEFLQMLLLDGCFVLVSLGGTKGILALTSTGQVNEENLTSEENLVGNEGQNISHSDNVSEVNITRNERLGQEGNQNCQGEETHEVNITRNESQGQEGNQNCEGEETHEVNITRNESQGQQEGNRNCEREETQRTEFDDEIGQWFFRFFNHDLFLLENQIPFFIVKKIFEVVAGDNFCGEAFTDEIAKFVEAALRWFPKSIQESDRPKDFHHLLHLCHMYFRPSQRAEEYNDQSVPQNFLRFLSFGRRYLKIRHYPDETEQGQSVSLEMPSLHDGQQLNRWRRAEQYHEAGVKFKKRRHDKLHPHSLLDINFSNGAMEIPFIVVDEYTGTLFRNLIAFEQTCPQFGDDFTAYIVFLSQLVSMPEDVTLLARREIIVHHLDSDEMVSDLFTMLSKDVVFDFNGQYYLKSLCQIMEDYYQSRLNRWIAWLWLNHFSNPWMGLAAFATVIVLICTIVQTIYGILAYTNPPG